MNEVRIIDNANKTLNSGCAKTLKTTYQTLYAVTVRTCVSIYCVLKGKYQSCYTV
ncbi:MAG: hypothetical protein FWH37_08850 [Candidatus Bathyarchaeota archaeon]|nr:hypothetical protein [Candidatus Termiticorpusculum sp.]